jgi:hypothetical protein
MPNIYQELLATAVEAYQNAGNNFHPDIASAEIAAALDGFNLPLERIGAAIAGRSSGTTESYATAARNALRLLDAQHIVLRTAMESAARADRGKIARAPALDQAALAQRAKVQQSADQQLLGQVTELIADARQDAAAPPVPGGDPTSLQPIDVEALKLSLAARASAEDKFATAEVDQIGGQRAPSAADTLKAIDLAGLEASLAARASSDDKFATAEIDQISGQLGRVTPPRHSG